MPLTLTTPIQTTAGYVTVQSLRVTVVNDATAVIVEANWCSCDSLGNPTGPPQHITLTPADEAAFLSAAGGWRQRLLAAIQSNQGATLAGSIT